MSGSRMPQARRPGRCGTNDVVPLQGTVLFCNLIRGLPLRYLSLSRFFIKKLWETVEGDLARFHGKAGDTGHIIAHIIQHSHSQGLVVGVINTQCVCAECYQDDSGLPRMVWLRLNRAGA
jgi:hypothetical protein